ncbi:MAG: PaaI family thioesterase [Halorientalis sp.]
MSDDGDAAAAAEQPLNAEAARAVLDEHGYLSWLDLSLESLAPGRAVMTLPYREELANWVTGTLHGGVTATVVDTCSAFALRTELDDPMGTTLATTDLDVKYVRPATADLHTEAEVVRCGTSTGVTRVTVESTTPEGERKTVATGATTYRLFGEGEL